MTDKKERLKQLDTSTLLDVVKNYRQYGYDDDLRLCAISILEERGISLERLALSGNLTNDTYNRATDLYHSFKKSSKITLFLYISFLVFLFFVPILALISNALFLVFLWKTYFIQKEFHEVINSDEGVAILISYCLGMPFYIIVYFYLQSQMKERMMSIK